MVNWSGLARSGVLCLLLLTAGTSTLSAESSRVQALASYSQTVTLPLVQRAYPAAEPTVEPPVPPAWGTPTEPNLKVAFIGDTGNGAGFEQVLKLILAEGADAVVHMGDFDYVGDPVGFEATINRILGPDFAYLSILGNHDVESWNAGCSNRKGCYAPYLQARLGRLGIVPDDPNLNDQMYSVVFKGLKVVFAGQEAVGDSIYAPYIERQLIEDSHVWRICAWHKNQAAMQVGGKGNEMGWRVYETCAREGAIVATAHEHSYQRTKTLTSMQYQEVDPEWPDPTQLRAGRGATFAFVSGLGGRSIREQQRCLPAAYPYGCNQEWASIYTSNQKANFGALFVEFHVDGDPYKARGYFKYVDNQVVDQFDVVATPR